MKILWIITVNRGQAGPERRPSLLSFTLSSSSSRDLPLFLNLSALLRRRLNTTTRRELERGADGGRIEIHANSRRPGEGRGNPLFEIFVFLPPARPPSLLASAIKALTLLTSSFLWPPSSVPGLRSPSASNSSSFIETNRLGVTPGRARRWLGAARGRSEWRVFICLRDAAGIHLLQRHPIFSLARSARARWIFERGLLDGDIQLPPYTALHCLYCFFWCWIRAVVYDSGGRKDSLRQIPNEAVIN